MAKVVPLMDTFAGGMKRDIPRSQLPGNAVWNVIDYIPGLDAPLTKRGGYSYASNDISATKATAAYVVAGYHAPFAAAQKNVAIDEDGELYTIATNGTVTDVGAALASVARLAFHRNLLIIPGSDGTTAPKQYNGSAIANLGGSPPAGKYVGVYKDRTVLSGSSANPNYYYFSGPGDPGSWDTTYGFISGSYPSVAVGTLRNAVILFSKQKIERIRGSIPPPGTDMTVEPLFDAGCLDARSLAFFEDFVVWADSGGLYMTDGTQPLDITGRCGMKRYWQDTFSAYTSSWTLAGGRYRNWYLLSIMNGSTFVDAFAIDPFANVWLRLSNLKAVMFWEAIGMPETYFGSRAAPRVGSISSMWSPAAGVKNDADGTAVTPTLETPFWELSQAKAVVREAYVTYDLRDASSDNPVLTLSTVKYPEDTSYTNVTDYNGTAFTLAETSTRTRARRKIHVRTEGIGAKLAQTNASSATRIWRIELLAHPTDPFRVG